MNVLVLADSDSYLKWAVTRARELSAECNVEVVVLANAVTPSARQRADAVAGRWVDVSVISLAEATDRITSTADAVILACRGPLIEFLFDEVLGDLPRRPVVVAGIPGLWFPPTRRGLDYRSNVDVLVVHSRREREAVEAANPAGGPQVALATLIEEPRHLRQHRPSRRPAHASATPGAGRGAGAVIFAPQALVPGSRHERAALLDGLVRTATANPSTPVLIKLRGEEGDAQTHSEFASYPALARELRVEIPRNLRFVQGPLSDFLDGAKALVTVSSTAALEALGAGVPTVVLRDFGVSTDNLNEVFEGSGLWGDLNGLERLEFPQVDAGWMTDNYFHENHESNWVDTLAHLAADAAALAELRGRRPAAPAPVGARGTLRRARVRAQALGRADVWWRRALAGLVLRPVSVVRSVVIRFQGSRPARSKRPESSGAAA